MLLTPSSFLLLLILLLPLLPLLLSSTVTFSNDPTTVVYSTCSKSHYPPNSPYQFNLNSLLSSLSAASSFTLYSQFITSSPSISGLFQCHGDLSISRCSACLHSAISLLPSLCSTSSSSSIQLHGCYLRYSNDTFLGLPDTKLQYKTCSTSGNGGGDEFLADKDEAFAAAAVAPLTGSSYRVATAGSVRVEVQCMGDLSLRDCDDCVLAADDQAKVSCSGAAAGEIYLGKCYVWYSGRGEIPEGSGGGAGGGTGGHNKDDEVGKTVAIMIGIIAVIVFIAICLYYVKRKAKGKQ